MQQAATVRNSKPHPTARHCNGSQRTQRTLTAAESQLIRTIPPVYLSAVEAAIYMDISERNFRTLATQGIFPSIRIGRRLLFRRDALDAALARLESDSTKIPISPPRPPAPRRGEQTKTNGLNH